MNEHNLKNYTLYVMGAVVALLLAWAIFGGKGRDDASQFAASHTAAPETKEVEDEQQLTPVASPAESAPAPSVTPSEKKAPEARNQGSAAAPSDEEAGAGGDGIVARILASDAEIRRANPYESHLAGMPDGGAKMKINYLGATLGRVFNDSNYLHLDAAQSIGITPVASVKDAWNAGRSLQRLQSCEEYYLDNLTHSFPYLVPEAHTLLRDIGAAFRDSLQARGGGDYRIKVTSVLRTPKMVGRLRRRNINAVATSAHLFGTTFDISYTKFICDSASTPRTQEDLKNLLGEVIYNLREQGRCYVKYERKQACFHITAR